MFKVRCPIWQEVFLLVAEQSTFRREPDGREDRLAEPGHTGFSRVQSTSVTILLQPIESTAWSSVEYAVSAGSRAVEAVYLEPIPRAAIVHVDDGIDNRSGRATFSSGSKTGDDEQTYEAPQHGLDEVVV